MIQSILFIDRNWDRHCVRPDISVFPFLSIFTPTNDLPSILSARHLVLPWDVLLQFHVTCKATPSPAFAR